MKTYNKRLKTIGYDHDPEASSSQYDQWTCNKVGDDGYQVHKVIYVQHKGDLKEISGNEQKLINGKWVEMPFSLNEVEYDAIKSYCEEKNFTGNIVWYEEDGVYKLRGE